MDAFRVKKQKDIKSKPLECTLDSLHTELLSKLQVQNPEDARKRLADIDAQLANMGHDVDKLVHMTRLMDERASIQKKLGDTQAVENYYTKCADLMLQYYGTATTNTPAETALKSNPFHTFVAPKTESATSKRNLFAEYANRMKLPPMTIADNSVIPDFCGQCKVAREEDTQEGMLICPSCGSEEYQMVVSDHPSFGEQPNERSNYAYKKMNHLVEILNQFQAKESTIIPEEVMAEIRVELKKRRIADLSELNEIGLRDILKKLGRSKYYEHMTHILCRLNGKPPPTTLTPEMEAKICTMFQEILAPFVLFCPDDRINLLSYPYILYKMFELLELDEHKSYFSLLKSRDRLIEHDHVWKQICEYLQWEFIPSV